MEIWQKILTVLGLDAYFDEVFKTLLLPAVILMNIFD